MEYCPIWLHTRTIGDWFYLPFLLVEGVLMRLKVLDWVLFSVKSSAGAGCCEANESSKLLRDYKINSAPKNIRSIELPYMSMPIHTLAQGYA